LAVERTVAEVEIVVDVVPVPVLVVVVVAAVLVLAMVLAVVRMPVTVGVPSSPSDACSSPSPRKNTVFSFTLGEDVPEGGDETELVALGLLDARPEPGMPRFELGDIGLLSALMNSPVAIE
jgi:hypothetical protein